MFKDKAFVRKELDKQLRAVHVSILQLEGIKHLQVLFLLPLSSIPKSVIKTRLIYDCFWSRLNVKVKIEAPKEAMRFRRSLHRLLDCVLAADHRLGPNFLS